MTKHQTTSLPQPVKSFSDALANLFISLEEEQYHDPLVPFVQRKEKIIKAVEEKMVEFRAPYVRAQELLKQRFLKEEKAHRDIPEDARYEQWEKALQKLQNDMQDADNLLKTEDTKNLQEMLHIPYAFLQRAYTYGQVLMQDGRFEDAQSIFYFLCNLNPMIFQFWFSQAVCFQALERWEEAIYTFTACLPLEQQTSLIFFQIARCYFKLNNFERCREALDGCITYAESQDAHIVEDAKKIKKTLEKV